MQASRDAHATGVLSVLGSLWDATEVPEQERAHFVRLMKGQLRLHAASLEKVRRVMHLDWGDGHSLLTHS